MNGLSQSAVTDESEAREAEKWRRASALWFPAIGSYHVEELMEETLKGKSVTYANFGRGIKECPRWIYIYGEGSGGRRR